MYSGEESKLLRLKDVSKLTSLGQSTVNLWVAQGKFPKPTVLSMTIKVWRLKDVVAWIDQKVEDQKCEIESEAPKPELRLVNG
jgi:predicted DNA-binding transcriptional regulator AlpA